MGVYKTYRSTGTRQRAVLVTGDGRRSLERERGNREPARAIAWCSASSSFPGTTRSCACGV